MTTIKLNLDIGEVNTIIKALSERSFREVYELIGKIHAQSNTQLPKQIEELQEENQGLTE